MPNKRLTVRDKLIRQQQATFVGREVQLRSYEDNLQRDPNADAEAKKGNKACKAALEKALLSCLALPALTYFFYDAKPAVFNPCFLNA